MNWGIGINSVVFEQNKDIYNQVVQLSFKIG